MECIMHTHWCLSEPDVIINVIVEDIDWDQAMADNRSSSFLRSADVTERTVGISLNK